MTMGIYKMHIKETNIKNRVNLIKAKKKKMETKNILKDLIYHE